MTSKIKPITLLKAGIFNGDLEKAVKEFNPQIKPITGSLNDNTNKYTIYESGNNPYLLIIAQRKNKITTSNKPNTFLTITSYDETMNLVLYKKIKGCLKTELDVEPSQWSKQNFNIFNLVFPMYEKILNYKSINPKKINQHDNTI